MADLFLWDEVNPYDIVLRTSATAAATTSPAAGGRRLRGNLGESWSPKKKPVRQRISEVEQVPHPTGTGFAVHTAVAPHTLIGTGVVTGTTRTPAPTRTAAASFGARIPVPVAAGFVVDPDEDDLLFTL